MNGDSAGESLVRREAQKKSRHLPLRKLMDQAGGVMSALRPCFMASPLSVSQLLPSGAALFDVVLFDEASQILPEDAVAALLGVARRSSREIRISSRRPLHVHVDDRANRMTPITIRIAPRALKVLVDRL